jgi:hypothetical protein
LRGLPHGLSGRKDVLLGPHGSPECQAEYELVLAQIRVAPDAAIVLDRQAPHLAVNEVLLAFWKHA